MVCSDCGWTCNCIYFHDWSCTEKHEPYHLNILRERDGYTKDTTSIPSIFGSKRHIKRCQSCENEIGVTNHVCKTKDNALDYLDFLVLIDKKKLDDLRGKNE